jgi:mannose-6-phosphate isomerase-like protein (cupin superfamily)
MHILPGVHNRHELRVSELRWRAGAPTARKIPGGHDRRLKLMKVIDPLKFKAERAWGALDICEMDNATVRLHWTDQPYSWHVNDGREVFVVLSGEVLMHYREGTEERSARLSVGDIFYADEGEEHYAQPIGEARILVIERKGSI